MIKINFGPPEPTWWKKAEYSVFLMKYCHLINDISAMDNNKWIRQFLKSNLSQSP